MYRTGAGIWTDFRPSCDMGIGIPRSSLASRTTRTEAPNEDIHTPAGFPLVDTPERHRSRDTLGLEPEHAKPAPVGGCGLRLFDSPFACKGRARSILRNCVKVQGSA